MPEAAICVQDIDVQCVLQFTLIHAAGCALHRHTSRVIHRLELSFAFQFFVNSAPSRTASFEQRIANGHRPRHGRRRHGDGARQRAYGYVRVVKVERCVDDDGWAIATAIR